MRDGKQTLDHYYQEMRWRLLSLAADLDRIGRAEGGPQVLADDPRMRQLREAFRVLLEDRRERAERVQMILSDRTPPPAHRPRPPVAADQYPDRPAGAAERHGPT